MMSTTTTPPERGEHFPRRRRGLVTSAALAGALTLALSVGGCSAFGSIIADDDPRPTASNTVAPSRTPLSTSTPSATTAPSPTSTVDPGLPVVNIDDRPLYPVAQTLVTEMFARYSDRTGAKYAYALVPDTPAGDDYAHGFLLLLADQKSVFAFLPSTQSQDVAALDTQLQGYIDKANETERKFLAGEPMGVTIKITNSDGSVFESDGTNTPFD